MTSKWCRKCGDVKDVTQGFARNPQRADGWHSYCKDCNNALIAAVRAQRKRAHRCLFCNQPCESGTLCAPCRDKQGKAKRALYRTRRKQGICTQCGAQGAPGTSRCDPCLLLVKRRSRAYYAQHRDKCLASTRATRARPAAPTG